MQGHKEVAVSDEELMESLEDRSLSRRDILLARCGRRRRHVPPHAGFGVRRAGRART